MKLNPDCIRNILLFLEETLEISSELEIKSLTLYQISDDIKYPIGEVANTLLALNKAGFIDMVHNATSTNKIYRMSVKRITYSGYQFIETIRPKTVWEEIKDTLKPIGSFSVPIIQEVGSEYIKSKISTLNN